MAFIEPCFGIGHNLSLICQMTSEDIKHQLIIIISTVSFLWRSRGLFHTGEAFWKLVLEWCLFYVRPFRFDVSRLPHDETYPWVFTVRRSQVTLATPSIAFRHLPPNLPDLVTPLKPHSLSPRSCPGTDAVSALRKVRVLIRLWKQPSNMVSYKTNVGYNLSCL